MSLLDFTESAGLLLAQAADAAPASSVRVESVWDFILKGGIMMIPIGICSLIALTVVVERFISLRRRLVIPPGFLDGLRRRMGEGLTDKAAGLAYCRSDGSAVSNVFAAGLKRLGGPIEVVERHIQESGQREVLKLRKRLRVLSVIAAVAPLLGLLGTIFGMITAFQTVAMSAEALGKTELLAGGIYEAMITTAAGLVVAIPALIGYHWLSARVQSLVMEVDEITVDFIEEISLGRHAAPTAPPVVPATAPTAPPPLPGMATS